MKDDALHETRASARKMLSLLRHLRGIRPKQAVGRIEEQLSHRYDPSRCARLRVEDTLGGRYKVKGKLGWGQFSTV